MKYRKVIFVLYGGILFTLIAGFAYMQTNAGQQLKLSLRTDKDTYKFGEPVRFVFGLRNDSNSPISLLDAFGTGTGNLHVEISADGKKFVGFDNPQWGIVDCFCKTLIEPNKSVDASGQVLWVWAKQDVPAFRLTKPGDYYLRARYTAYVDGIQESKKIESEPIMITIEGSIGDDLEVWNKIKDKGDFAYFISEGDVQIPSYKPEQREEFLQEVNGIMTDHPNSFYSQSLRQSLERFRASEVKRQESLRKMQKQKPQ